MFNIKPLLKNPIFLVSISPLLLLFILIPVISDIDLMVSSYFFDPATGFEKNALNLFAYRYLDWTGKGFTIIVALLYGASFRYKNLMHYRPAMLYLLLAMGLGSLITHGLFKSFWGRPRPVQTVYFNGSQPFYPFYLPGRVDSPRHFASFLSGHATMGFYFFALTILSLRIRSNALFYLSIALTSILGLWLSYARISLGGHYFSDCLAAAAVMWLSAYVCDYWVFKRGGMR